MVTKATLEMLKKSRISSGRCPECGRPKLRHSLYCEKHKITRNMNAYHRDRWKKCKAQKICPTCGRFTDGRYVRCGLCREKARIYAKIYYSRPDIG
jgi:hypothetical protein